MMLIDAVASAFFLLAFTSMAHTSPAFTTRAKNAVEIEHRTLDELYQAALKESRTLTVAWGGDSKNPLKRLTHSTNLPHSHSPRLQNTHNLLLPVQLPRNPSKRHPQPIQILGTGHRYRLLHLKWLFQRRRRSGITKPPRLSQMERRRKIVEL